MEHKKCAVNIRWEKKFRWEKILIFVCLLENIKFKAIFLYSLPPKHVFNPILTDRIQICTHLKFYLLVFMYF